MGTPYLAEELDGSGQVLASYEAVPNPETAAPAGLVHLVRTVTHDSLVALPDPRAADPGVRDALVLHTRTDLWIGASNMTIVRAAVAHVAGLAAGDDPVREHHTGPDGVTTETPVDPQLQTPPTGGAFGMQGGLLLQLVSTRPVAANPRRPRPSADSLVRSTLVMDGSLRRSAMAHGRFLAPNDDSDEEDSEQDSAADALTTPWAVHLHPDVCPAADVGGSAAVCLWSHLTCLPSSYLDDDEPATPRDLHEASAPCFADLRDATHAEPLLVVAISLVLTHEPCALVRRLLDAAPPPLGWYGMPDAADVLSRMCLDPALGSGAPFLTERLLDALIGILVPAAHSMRPLQSFIAHVLTSPLSYRYATLPEHVLVALTALEGPSTAVVDAALIAAQSLSPGQALRASQPRELAAKVAASVARKARAFHRQLRPVLVSHSTDGAAVELSHAPPSVHDAAAADDRIFQHLVSELSSAAAADEARRDARLDATVRASAQWRALPPVLQEQWVASALHVTARAARALLAAAQSTSERAALEAHGIALLRDALLMKRGHHRPGMTSDNAAVGDVDGSDVQLRLVLEAVGNLGSPASLPLVLNYTNHAVRRVRIAAIGALRFIPADTPVPDALRVRRVTRRELISQPPPESSNGPRSLALEPHMTLNVGIELPASSPLLTLFPESVVGVGCDTVEGVLISTLRDHHDAETAAAAVEVLHALPALSDAGIAEILDVFDGRFGASDIGRPAASAVTDCMRVRPACRGQSAAACRESCTSIVSNERRLARKLAGALRTHLEERPVRAAARRGLRQWSAGQPAIAASHARVLSALQNSDTSMIVRSASVQAHIGLTPGSVHASRRTAAQAPSNPLYARHLARARRLGIWSIIDVGVGSNGAWDDSYGSGKAGATDHADSFVTGSEAIDLHTTTISHASTGASECLCAERDVIGLDLPVRCICRLCDDDSLGP